MPDQNVHLGILGEAKLLAPSQRLWQVVCDSQALTGYRGFDATFGSHLEPSPTSWRNDYTPITFADIRDKLVDKAAAMGKKGVILIVGSDALVERNYSALKLIALQSGVRLQFVLESTLYRNLDYTAIGVATAIATKAGGTPWFPDAPISPLGLFVGIGFSFDPRSRSLYYGVLEVHDQFGRLLSIKAESFKLLEAEDIGELEPGDFEPSDDDAFDEQRTKGLFIPGEKLSTLLSEVSKRYNASSIIVHKSAPYHAQEIAASRKVKPEPVLVHMEASNPYRCFDNSSSNAVPSRGLLLEDTENANRAIFLTTGNVHDVRLVLHRLGTPRPWELNLATNPDNLQIKDVATQMLSLTKLDWNSMSPEVRDPITLKYAKVAAQMAAHDKLQQMPKLALDFRDLI
jgi:argonaute-like protein implicated in RNA metabolism and viral defense